MKEYLFGLFGLICLTNFDLLYAASEDCLDDGTVTFLCGPVSPEDLVQIPDSPWVIASGMEDDGYVYFIDSQQLDSVPVYPATLSDHRADSVRFNNCRGPQT